MVSSCFELNLRIQEDNSTAEFLKSRLKQHGIAGTTAVAGLYDVKRGFPCPCRVVVIDELEMNDANVPLLLLRISFDMRKIDAKDIFRPGIP
jgi:hypothetical protein